MDKIIGELELVTTLIRDTLYFDDKYKFDRRDINNVLYGFFNDLKKRGYLSNVKLVESNK